MENLMFIAEQLLFQKNNEHITTVVLQQNEN